MNDNDVQYQNLSKEVTDENRYVKNIQNQVEYLQERNKKLAMDNEELNRQVRKKRI